MSNYDFRHVYLPFCLQRLADGRYVVLNKDYKPLGFQTREKVEYEVYPIAATFLRLDSRTAAKLSFNGSQELEAIYLYDSNCVPTDSNQNMEKYLVRLEILAKLKLGDFEHDS